MRLRVAVITIALLQFTEATASATACNSVAACLFGNNVGTGVAVEGVSQKNVGVYGVSTSSHGVDGRSHNDFGVVGYTYSTLDASGAPGSAGLGKAGVYGIDAGRGGGNSGVLGTSVQGSGVQGQGATGVAGVGVGQSGTGVSGNGEYGALFSGNITTLSLSVNYDPLTDHNPPGNLIEAYGTFNAGDYISKVPVFLLDNFGNETIYGSLTANASITAVTKTTGRDVVSYAARTASPTLEDIGESNLRNGVATVALDPTFASAIDTGTFEVFITPHGNSNGLYTTNTRSGFSVHENNGGHSTLAFDYRFVAVPLDERTARHLPAATPMRGHPLMRDAARMLYRLRPND